MNSRGCDFGRYVCAISLGVAEGIEYQNFASGSVCNQIIAAPVAVCLCNLDIICLFRLFGNRRIVFRVVFRIVGGIRIVRVIRIIRCVRIVRILWVFSVVRLICTLWSLCVVRIIRHVRGHRGAGCHEGSCHQ